MKLANMSWAQAEEAFKRCTVGLLPIGTVENHGEHLPLGADLAVVEHIAEKASEMGDWLLLPPVPVGLSEHHRQFWGTLWVPPEVLARYVTDVLRSLADHGMHRVVLVDGQQYRPPTTLPVYLTANPVLQQVQSTLRREGIYVYLFYWWKAARELISDLGFSERDHAGALEASAVLAVDSGLVEREACSGSGDGDGVTWGRRLHGVPIGYDVVDFAPNGRVASSLEASEADGRKLIDQAAAELDGFCRWLAEQPEERLAPTLEKAEAWRGASNG